MGFKLVITSREEKFYEFASTPYHDNNKDLLPGRFRICTKIHVTVY